MPELGASGSVRGAASNGRPYRDHQQGGRLVVPDNLTPLPLPPYAPELNSMENVWEYLRSNWLSHKVWDTYDAILDACCDAWNTLTRAPERLTSITSRSWATAVIE